MINLKIINKQITQYIIVETANDFRTEIKISKIITISQQFKIFLRYFWFYLFTLKKKKMFTEIQRFITKHKNISNK